MILGILVGAAGLFIVGVAWVNRDPLSDEADPRKVLPYALGAVVAVAGGVALIIITSNGTDACGALTNCGAAH